jgi:hypothetical protein
MIIGKSGIKFGIIIVLVLSIIFSFPGCASAEIWDADDDGGRVIDFTASTGPNENPLLSGMALSKGSITFSDLGFENQTFVLNGQENKSFTINFDVSYPYSNGAIKFHFYTRDDDSSGPETEWNITVNEYNLENPSMYERDTWHTLNIPSNVLQNGSNKLEFTIKNRATTGNNSFTMFKDSYITEIHLAT